MKVKFLLVALFLALFPLFSYAHPGRTDASGCHTCRTNCPSWGLDYSEYHCHNAKALPQPMEPIRSHYGEGGTGTTEPWPEYKSTPVAPKKSTTIPSSSSASSITYSLAKGMENNQVLKLQQILARYPEIYPEGSITGYFGPATERAVKRLQKKYGFEQTGSTGPKTRNLLRGLRPDTQ